MNRECTAWVEQVYLYVLKLLVSMLAGWTRSTGIEDAVYVTGYMDLFGCMQVDWSRFHLDILFVDNDDFSNARFAHALFENIASWNGYGLSLYGWTCGTQVTDCPPAAERAVSLMIRANGLNTSPKLFTREPEQLDLRDMYIYDVRNADVMYACSWYIFN